MDGGEILFVDVTHNPDGAEVGDGGYRSRRIKGLGEFAGSGSEVENDTATWGNHSQRVI